MIILGLDPGLASTGWGVIRAEGNRLSHIANGQVRTDARAPLPQRLAKLHAALGEVVTEYAPAGAAVEEVFVNDNPQSTLKLAHARGVVLLAARAAELEIFEYAPRSVKSAVVGYGAAEKEQVAKMVRMLLPGCASLKMSADASDALAIAICHAHTAGTAARLKLKA